jgi:hypothetical protein
LFQPLTTVKWYPGFSFKPLLSHSSCKLAPLQLGLPACHLNIIDADEDDDNEDDDDDEDEDNDNDDNDVNDEDNDGDGGDDSGGGRRGGVRGFRGVAPPQNAPFKCPGSTSRYFGVYW